MMTLFAIWVCGAFLGIVITFIIALDLEFEFDFWKWAGISIVWPLYLVGKLANGAYRGFCEEVL
jgi:uncharacterized membrane protein YecN with MAPEG domain